jgi:hypothetical protein
MVTADSDGPVEVAVPFTGTVRPAGELRVRRQPAGHEAVTVLTRSGGGVPHRPGRRPGEPHLEIAWPVG